MEKPEVGGRPGKASERVAEVARSAVGARERRVIEPPDAFGRPDDRPAADRDLAILAGSQRSAAEEARSCAKLAVFQAAQVLRKERNLFEFRGRRCDAVANVSKCLHLQSASRSVGHL